MSFDTHVTAISDIDIRHRTEQEVNLHEEPVSVKKMRDLVITLKGYCMTGLTNWYVAPVRWSWFVPYACKESYTRAQRFVHGFYLGRYADVDAGDFQVWTKQNEEAWGVDHPDTIWNLPNFHPLAVMRQYIGRVLKKPDERLGQQEQPPIPETLSA